MKKFLIVLFSVGVLSGCSLFRNNKTGCPTNGKNVGAEKILSGDKKAMKAVKNAKKFNS
ncbi:MAG: hypothetical protein ABIO55_13695 [Ginsengibacter sp.]